MSTVGTITKLATGAVGKAAHAVTHPVTTVTSAAGQARRVAAAVIGGEHEKSEQREPSVPLAPDPAAAADEAVAAEKARAAEPRPVEPEPAAPEVRTPAGTTAAGPGYNPDTDETDLHQPGTEPLMDPSLTKAVRAEAETMRKASERGGE